MDRIKAYFKSARLNASTLKRLDNPKWIKWKMDNPNAEDEEKRHFRIGGAIDAILTAPETFNDQFVVLHQNRPSGKMGVFIDALPLDITPDSEPEEYEPAYKKAGYKMNITSIIDSLWTKDKYKDYYLSRKTSQGKSILTLDELQEVNHCREYIFNNPYTRDYFININPNRKVLYQVPIFFTYKNIPCKGMLDGLVIDHEKKIVQPFDLKTIGRSITNFRSSYVTLGYYIQAAMYDAALRSEEGKEMLAGENAAEYEVLPLEFVVTEKKTYHSNPARIFRMSELDLKAAYEGGVDKSGKIYKGLNALIKDYLWHLDSGKWDLPRNLYESKGIEFLDILSPITLKNDENK